MELIDIVDENGNYTGIVMDKEEAHDKNLLHNEIVVFIINDKNQVLLQKRSANKRFNPNQWGVCAGHVDTQETLEDTSLRELKEEVGVDFSIDDLAPFLEKELILQETNSHIFYYFYVKSNLKESDFTIQTEELSEVKWFDIDEVIKMIKEEDKSTVFKDKDLRLFEELKKL